MIRFILASKKDKYDNAEIITDIDKPTIKFEFTKWLENHVEEGSFSDYLRNKFPTKTIIDLDDIEDCSFEA
ncbi:hypothetical protein [Paenibacillus polymyxa]|uniref:hypothetical protein n=1 Tax=Paenibacillus polymyxa TaxID=1406 RepID=UPI0025B69379|nr:hypothetical protein [Paenibacillus polymyxa]MDN4086027.1 hypothetical protein [Paenibacillus polymyxa]MDN4108348.1 hypothetical protein [Paenibacillus polymyxa]